MDINSILDNIIFKKLKEQQQEQIDAIEKVKNIRTIS